MKLVTKARFLCGLLFAVVTQTSFAAPISITMPESVSADELAKLRALEPQIPTLMNSLTYEGMYNDYQRTSNLSHDIYAGYFANNNPAGQFVAGSPNYAYSEGWSGLRWTFFYTKRCDEFGQLVNMFKYLDQSVYKNAYHIVRIYYAYLVSQMTDTYGDLPIAPTVSGGIFESSDLYCPYDSQKEIYDMIFRILDESVRKIKPNECSFKFGSEDKCFQGDEEKWIRFANTLRLRLALRISNVDPYWAKVEGEAALAHKGGLMKSNADNFQTTPKYAPIAVGGENSGGDENIHALCSFMYLDVCMSKDLEVAYKNQSLILDPRCTVSWYRPTPKDKLMIGEEIQEIEDGREMVENEYRGVEVGSGKIDRTSDQCSVLKTNAFDPKGILRDSHWFGYARESVWLGYAESRFLLAEAALREWAGASETPQSYFEEGIRASFDYFKLSDQASDYIKSLQIYQPKGTNPFAGTDKEAILEQIITQKWIAMMPNGSEGWAEFRRTDFPRLQNHTNNQSFGEVPDNKFIKRISYVYDQMDNNWENMPDVNQGSRVWWDLYDTNDDNGRRNTTSNFPVITSIEHSSVEESKSLDVYPNPVRQNGYIYVKGQVDGNIRILTIDGDIVKQELQYGSNGSMSVAGLPTGVYLVESSSAIGRLVSKLVIL